ncbi:hypothetical protein [Anaerosporobacter sp.]
MILFNAQQIYMESGPGNCFNLKNLNSNNPDCTPDSSKDSNSSKTTDNTCTSNTDAASIMNTYQSQINQLNAEIKALKRWMDEY